MIHVLDPLKGLAHARPATKKPTRKTSAFHDALNISETSTPPETQALNALTLVAPFLSSYAFEDQPESQKMINQGNTMLRQLETLRHGLLTGQYTSAELVELKRCLDHIPTERTSGELEDIIREIHLRVAVECEKFQRSIAI